jgi:hypothetical protein
LYFYSVWFILIDFFKKWKKEEGTGKWNLEREKGRGKVRVAPEWLRNESGLARA